eukprot:gene4393-8362_t
MPHEGTAQQQEEGTGRMGARRPANGARANGTDRGHCGRERWAPDSKVNAAPSRAPAYILQSLEIAASSENCRR